MAIVATGVASLSALLLKPRLERAVRERIESAAMRQGMVARVGSVRVGLWPFVRLDGFDLDLGHGSRLRVEGIEATYPGRLRLALRDATLVGPSDITIRSPVSAWFVENLRGEDLALTLAEPQSGMSIRKVVDATGSGWNVEARKLDTGRLFEVRRDGGPLLEAGVADGIVNLRTSADALRFQVDVSARGARFRALADEVGEVARLGDATDVALSFDGAWQRGEGTLDIPEIHGNLVGAELSGSIKLFGLETEPSVDLVLGTRQLEFGRLLRAAGLEVPEGLRAATGGIHDLGSASIEVSVRGSAAEPAAIAVKQEIDFTPPRQMPPAISRLRGDFVFRSEGSGPHRPVQVSPASPDFISLRDVPPLFVRTLLLAEDAGFYGHRGIDLRELPTALLTNLSRGDAARGASTITQQLAKNLFLSRDKEVGRKLQELAIAFLLESALGKDRILEIYLNIIEWGPELRGLRPAARRYFGREPRELTPAQMAFLVSIIPGPIKYQRSIARGTPSPGLRSLIDDLLTKLRSVDAIGDEEYLQALRDPLVIGGGSITPPPAAKLSTQGTTRSVHNRGDSFPPG